ncbi:MAG TPA: hypothetical protein PK918_08450 [Methanotrichaceae archaeon]|nr:hypothetical protein [Methanotrichaceae archaeon]HQI92027.1 hypothetical protein [Methanotrichaceae archaeon]
MFGGGQTLRYREYGSQWLYHCSQLQESFGITEKRLISRAKYVQVAAE